MRKLTVFLKQILLVCILFVLAILLWNRQSLKNSAKPAVHGNPYAGGSGQGYVSAEYTGRIDGSGAK